MNEFDEACNKAAKVRISHYRAMLNYVLDSEKPLVMASEAIDRMISLIDAENNNIKSYEYERDAKLDAMTGGE